MRDEAFYLGCKGCTSPTYASCPWLTLSPNYTLNPEPKALNPKAPAADRGRLG